MTLTNVTNEIIRQVNAQGIQYKSIVAVDENTVRFVRGRGRSVTVSYNHGTDLYDCRVYRYHTRTIETIEDRTIEGLPADCLINLF